MRVFETDIRRLAVLLLPTFLRRNLLIAMLHAMVAPANSWHSLFLRNRTNNLEQLLINGQVCHLRRALNDAFPEAGRTIRIEDGKVSGEWVYACDEDAASCLTVPDNGSLFLCDENFILLGKNRFEVTVPAVLQENKDAIARLKAILNTYKLLSKSYGIIYE